MRCGRRAGRSRRSPGMSVRPVRLGSSNAWPLREASGHTYGADRLHRQLRRHGIRDGSKRVEWLMVQQGWRGPFLLRGWSNSGAVVRILSRRGHRVGALPSRTPARKARLDSSLSVTHCLSVWRLIVEPGRRASGVSGDRYSGAISPWRSTSGSPV
ncbi:IS3 family transposase [Micromonospora sp. NPDC005707]|uniref:IS3 family transposase n=1 Tax=Micromonospora sp. NPDC005707 TaxID=3157050 RepID=UPI0033E8C97C